MLEVNALTSGYRQVPVIQEISFDIAPGEVVALVGLNGAGKSTLLKSILGLLTPQKGTVKLNGVTLQVNHNQYASQIAYIPETPILYETLTLKEHLEMTALGYGIPIETVMERAKPLLSLFRLDKQLEWFPTHFSKGMKQKVMIICALVTDARLLIIDEPFLGLDPLAIQHLTTLLTERAAQGVSVLLTTHILGLVSSLADRYLMMRSGCIVAQGDLEVLRQVLNAPNATLDQLYIRMVELEESL